MVSTSAMSFDCSHCGYPRGLHTPDCPNAIHVAPAPMPTVESGDNRSHSIPKWAIVAGLLVVVGVVGWLAYRALRDRFQIPDSFELPDLPPQPITRRPYLEPKPIDPDIAEEILDDVMSTDWLEP